MDDTIATSAEALENAALPRCREVHADPKVAPPQTNRSAQNKSPAQWAYERLILYIQNFEETLDAEHEVAMGFAGDSSGTIRIAGLGYYDPDIITFYGTDSHGAKTQLVQHVTQLSVMLRALPKPVEQKKATRIGFRLAQSLKDEDEAADAAPDPHDKTSA
ncbi:DUF6173 family protein [Thalassorhabdomicrobium marinisediminis]|uniref:Uncharacterized protein n=1 Tax=Thalassorhabdomicrobium marinisediminis TaxID=2170577 RepID=A0A2T7FYV3_9RHOB|nr:DUF6173 family protein [Thalassorhabdomicrobium marinisediminis]PVA07345.1 hypothetical protein DC363_05735 [Thalassorhabdomicrobium marinisediminis]